MQEAFKFPLTYNMVDLTASSNHRDPALRKPPHFLFDLATQE